MTNFKAVALTFLLVTNAARAQEPDAAASNEAICRASGTLSISYRPPMTQISEVLKTLHRAPNDSNVGPDQYRSAAEVEILVGSEGAPTNVSITKSSGNRAVDRALLIWARDTRFVGACQLGRISIELH